MTQQLITTRPYMGRGLINHDPRSKEFSTSILDLPEPRTKTWRRGGAYDQGQLPHCVAYTGKGILNTARLSAAVDYDIRSQYSTQWMYDGAQRRDQWDGEDYDGTSGLGLCRFLRRKGLINEYRWCFTLDMYLKTLAHVGPIGFGTWWKDTMMTTSPDGFLNVSGSNIGGHEVELIGVNMEAGYVEGMNSWGKHWGVNGRFRLMFTDLEALIGQQADGFVITS